VRIGLLLPLFVMISSVVTETWRAVPTYGAAESGPSVLLPGANEVIVNRPAPSNHQVIFNYFAPP